MLKSHSKAHRLAHYNLCTILFLVSVDPADRAAALKLRELFRKNTLAANNQCDFDKTEKEKKLDSSPIRSSRQKYAKDNESSGHSVGFKP